MNKDQGYGIIERVIYGAVLWLGMKLVAAGYIDADTAAYIAAGAVTAVGSAYAWWHNRPVSVINRAADALPRNSVLVITPTPNASAADKSDAHELATAASDKVLAKT